MKCILERPYVSSAVLAEAALYPLDYALHQPFIYLELPVIRKWLTLPAFPLVLWRSGGLSRGIIGMGGPFAVVEGGSLTSQKT
jgi:hypothetical protein